eukprot:TRINITY_DN6779_c1_g1_i1.p1 TRINITY_DN6779_c1_g1~~TRINITY_DN6779_c1_g1_i1.p1  ORF type:complete len:410 (+),score=46.58 TRINITY_DN6779_c1_g1_i1:43-1230(+)
MSFVDSEGNPAGEVKETAKGRWHVMECSGKGLGLFAGKAFTAGEVIVEEEAIVVVDDEARVDNRIMESLLGEREKQILGRLANMGDGWVGVFNTNGFNCGEGQHAVFNTISRVNHCCVPNAFVDVDTETGIAKLKALTRIEQCHEVTISYHRDSHGLSKKMKRSMLKNTKKFECQCKTCSSEAPDPAMGGCSEDDETEEMQFFILSHCEDSGVERSLEEFVAGMHVVGGVLSYKHWGCLHIAMALLKNAVGAVEHYTESGDKPSAEKWTNILLKLLTFCTNRCKAITPSYLTSSYTLTLYDAAHCLLHTSSPPYPLIVLVFAFIAPFHSAYYSASDHDTKHIKKLLKDYEGCKVSGMGLDESEVATKDFLRINLNEGSLAAIERHTERLIRKMKK